MASVMAIGSEVIGECVEEIRIEVVRKILRMVLVSSQKDIEDGFGMPWIFSVWCSVPHWVCCQAALMAMVPGIGG